MKKDYVYERDAVKKVAKVKELNGSMLDERRSLNESRKEMI